MPLLIPISELAECFESVLSYSAEKKEHILLERGHLELFFYKSGKVANPFGQISTPTANVYFSKRCSLQHDLTALMILIRNSSLAPSDNRMSVYPVLIQARNNRKCLLGLGRLLVHICIDFNKNRFTGLGSLESQLLYSILPHLTLGVVILIL